MPRRIRTTRTRPREHEEVAEELSFRQQMEQRGVKPHHVSATGRKVWRFHSA